MDAERLKVRWDRNAQGMGRAVVVGERLQKNGAEIINRISQATIELLIA